MGHPGVKGYFRAKTIVLPALAGIKHEAFSEEKEWRLIGRGSTGEIDVAFRTGPLGVTPYVNLELPEDALATVIVGPGQNEELRRQGVERLLGESGYGHDDVHVQLPKSPFRG
jgi:hypothetical protein